MREPGAKALAAMLSPRSIAVIGATDQPGKLGATLVGNLQTFRGDVHYVNPRRSTVLGRDCYSRVADIGQDIDLALILVPFEAVEASLNDCARTGVRAAIILTGGYHEAGASGRASKQRIEALAVKSNLRLLGPNCTGVANPSAGLNACFLSVPDVPAGSVGLFGQTGTLLGGLLWDYRELNGGGVSQIVTLGDKLDLNELDVLEHFEHAQSVDVAAGYVEGLVDARAWLEQCRRVARKKPLILLRGGITVSGASAASSHTGRIVSASSVLAQQLDTAGITSVTDLPALLEYAAGFEHLIAHAGAKSRVAIATTSGAIGVVLSDLVDSAGLEIGELDATTVDEIKACGLAGVEFGPTEQIDLELPGEQVGLTRAVCQAVQVLSEDENVEVVLLALAALDHFADFNAHTVAVACQAARKPVFVWLYGRDELKAAWRKGFGRSLRVSSSPRAMVECIGAYQRWRRYAHDCVAPRRAPAAPPSRDDDDVGCVLDEADLRELLHEWRLPFVDARVVVGDQELPQAAGEIGYPVALKRLHSTLSHKTESGAVTLDIADASSLLCCASRNRLPGRWLVQKMVLSSIEAFVGVKHDPQLGAMISVGMGGILVELLDDVASRPAPLDQRSALELIESTRLGHLLHGFRGQPGGDKVALVELLLRVSELALGRPDLAELDFNPVMVHNVGEGLTIVDARAVRRADPLTTPDN